MTTRRQMILSTLADAVGPALGDDRDDAASRAKAHAEKTVHDHAHWMGDETIAMLLYPRFTALDLFGPQHMFGSLMGAKVLLVAEMADPVPSHSGVKVVPTTTFADCPEKLSILFVPGGSDGTLEAAERPAVRRFVRSCGEKAEWVTSVCTGSIILGAAALLDGYRATSHWATRPPLDAGSEAKAPKQVVTMTRDMFRDYNARIEQIAKTTR
jgi:cyclohexyl-isocyanide hydratase